MNRRFPEYGLLRRLSVVYLLFVNQGKNLIDRYYVAAGRDDIRQELLGYEKIRDILAEGQKGMIFLTAHVGTGSLR